MKQQISQIQKQSQIVSQAQVQFLTILNMNSQELESWLNSQYMENPFLEKTEHAKPVETNSFSVTHPYNNQYVSSQSTDTYSYQEPAVYEGKQIYHYLTEQLRYSDYSDLEWTAITYLIENLDETGYFTVDLKTFSEETSLPLSVLEKCFSILQGLEPYGIFSPNMATCLIRQLKKRNLGDKVLYRILSENMDELLCKKISPLQKKYKLSRDKIMAYHDLLSTLNPYPLFQFNPKAANHIIPDIICRMENGILIPALTHTTNYNYSISDYYLKMLQQTDNEDLKEYLQAKYTAAHNIMINIENREKTLLRIANAILEKQPDFFLRKGPLIPMNMTQIAEICELSTSTISRAVRDKYLQYPDGTIRMKDLFVSVSNKTERNEEAISADEVKELIANLIKSENPKKPLNDEEISSRLKEQDVIISRRTVAKYRSEMLIPTSRERKER